MYHHIFAILVLALSSTSAFRPSFSNSTAKWVDNSYVNYDDLVPVITSDGNNYYIGRTSQQGGAIPGPVHQSTLFYSTQGRVQTTKRDFEVLVFPYSDFSWVEVKNSFGQNQWPENIFPAGLDPRTKEDLFVCRALHRNGAVTKRRFGKVSMSTRSCDIIFEWNEHSYRDFDVLAYTPLKCSSDDQGLGNEHGKKKKVNWLLIGLIVCAVLIPIVGIIGFVSGRKCCRKREFEPVSTIYRP